MLTLCGHALSNYYNKVKLALLEKQIPFEEARVMTGLTLESVLAESPLAKIPYLRTEHGPMCESQVILEYLEAAYPAHPLLPADPFAAAKVREITTFVDLHLELQARELYVQAFFGGSVSEATQARVHARLTKNIAAFKRLARFAPFVAGDRFTMADCAAWPSLPLVALASKKVLGEDLLAAAEIDWKGYGRMLAERPTVAQVAADRKRAEAELAPPN